MIAGEKSLYFRLESENTDFEFFDFLEKRQHLLQTIIIQRKNLKTASIIECVRQYVEPRT